MALALNPKPRSPQAHNVWRRLEIDDEHRTILDRLSTGDIIGHDDGEMRWPDGEIVSVMHLAYLSTIGAVTTKSQIKITGFGLALLSL